MPRLQIPLNAIGNCRASQVDQYGEKLDFKSQWFVIYSIILVV
jgi:hypothetical protein